MESTISQILRSFSLTAKESLVFQRLLETGQQPASAVAANCELPRNTVRGVLDKLVKMGLVLRSKRGNTQLYLTEKADGLIRILQLRKESLMCELSNQIDFIKKHGSALEHDKSQVRPRVTFYEGYSGLVKVYEDTLTSKSGLRSWASFDANQQFLPKYFQNYYKRRARLGIPMISIHPDTELARKQTAHNKRYLRQSVLVPEKYLNLTPEVQVYDNKVNIVSFRDRLAVIIESTEVAAAMRAIFDLCFRTSARCYGRGKVTYSAGSSKLRRRER